MPLFYPRRFSKQHQKLMKYSHNTKVQELRDTRKCTQNTHKRLK